MSRPHRPQWCCGVAGFDFEMRFPPFMPLMIAQVLTDLCVAND